MSWVIKQVGHNTYLDECITKDGHTTGFSERTAMKFPSEHHAIMYLMGVQEETLRLSGGSSKSWIFKAEVVPCGS